MCVLIVLCKRGKWEKIYLARTPVSRDGNLTRTDNPSELIGAFLTAVMVLVFNVKKSAGFFFF